jgi:uncharacterized protein
MCLTILGAESLGVRSLCCLVKTADRRIVIDPGIALGYVRYGLLPHPLQVAVGRMIRKRIIRALDQATDVVVSHFHGDHVPLAEANPYQLSIKDLPSRLRAQRCWTIGDPGEPAALSQRFADISSVFGRNLRIAEGYSDGPLSFSEPLPHGGPQTQLGTVMMTRIENQGRIFVHASDIQLLDNSAVDRIIAWRPTTVLAAGPPLYPGRLGAAERKRAWDNAIRLVESAAARWKTPGPRSVPFIDSIAARAERSANAVRARRSMEHTACAATSTSSSTTTKALHGRLVPTFSNRSQARQFVRS